MTGDTPKRHRCPVCGYLLPEPAWTDDGGGSFEICACCGIQFGYTDAAGGDRVRRAELWQRWRSEWIQDGLPWRGASSPPGDYNPLEQLTHVTG